jgi:hypothetical protein
VTGVQLGGSLAGKLALELSSTTSRFLSRGFALPADDFFGTPFRTGAGFLLTMAASPQEEFRAVD